MTIPTGSKLLVSVPKSTPVAAENVPAKSSTGLSAPSVMETKASPENDFKSVLNQQMQQASVQKNGESSDESSDESADVKGFSDELNEFCCAQDVALELTEIPQNFETEWLHGVIPFLPESNELKAVLQGEVEAIDLKQTGVESELLPGQMILPSMTNRNREGGDSLPVMRQISSVNLSSVITPHAAAVSGSTAVPLAPQELVSFQLSSAEAMDAETAAELEQTLIKPESFKSVANELNLVVGKEGLLPAQTGTNGLNMNPPAMTGLTPATPEIQLSARLPASQWGDALGEKVAFLINHKLNKAEIRIDPPHLGKLDIQIQVKDDAATVVIHTQHAQTRDMIESASVRLREFLQEAGYSSVNVDVSHREQSFNGDHLSGQQTAQTQDEATAGSAALDQTSAGWQQSIVSMQMNNGRIDYFA